MQRALLRQEPRRAGRRGLREDVQLGVAGEDQDACLGAAGLDAPGSLDAVDTGKVDVHEDDVGRVVLGQPERRLDVRGGTDALEVGLRVDRDRHGLGERDVIIDDEHPLCHVLPRGSNGFGGPCANPPPIPEERVRTKTLARHATGFRDTPFPFSAP